MATAEVDIPTLDPVDGVLLACSGCGDTWLISPQPFRSWVFDKEDQGSLHFVEDDSDPARALTACGRSVASDELGLPPYLDEAAAVEIEREAPGSFDWCKDCLNAAAERVVDAPLPGIDAPLVPGADQVQ